MFCLPRATTIVHVRRRLAYTIPNRRQFDYAVRGSFMYLASSSRIGRFAAASSIDRFAITNSVDRFVIAIQTTASRFRSTKDGNDATLVFR
jgi:hypothetical protein